MNTQMSLLHVYVFSMLNKKISKTKISIGLSYFSHILSPIGSGFCIILLLI